MEQEKMNEMIAWAENYSRCIAYAEGIVKTEKEIRVAQIYLGDNYDVWSPSEWLTYCSKVERMEKSLTMKIKHFFKMVYGNDNSFCNLLKGKDYVDHWLEFKKFAHRIYCNCEI